MSFSTSFSEHFKNSIEYLIIVHLLKYLAFLNHMIQISHDSNIIISSYPQTHILAVSYKLSKLYLEICNAQVTTTEEKKEVINLKKKEFEMV